MGFFQRVLQRRQRSEARASTQDWVDLVMAAQEQGLLHTSMGSLTEEQSVGSYNGVVKRSSPVFALMLARLQVFSQARFQWTWFTGGERGDLFGSPELGVLERPWPGGTTADLLARMEMDVTGAGNAYIRRLRRTRFREDRLVRLRPDWVRIILGSREDVEHPSEAADVELVGYAYIPQGAGERILFLDPGEVAHYAPVPDPDEVYLGMSWVTPAIRDVFGDDLQTDYKRAYLRNAATVNLVMKFDPSVTVDQVRQFKELFEAEHVGAASAYKTLFIGGGADATTVGSNLQELDFTAVQGKVESRLAADAGVPPSWVGFSEGLQGSALNAGNFTAARRRFGDGTMQHLWANAAASLQTIVRPPDAGASLWFATRGVPFLHLDAQDEAQVQAEEAATITALVKDGFTPDSAIQAVTNHNWGLLQHSGLMSVQLQPPVTDQGAASAADGSTQNGARRALLEVYKP